MSGQNPFSTQHLMVSSNQNVLSPNSMLTQTPTTPNPAYGLPQQISPGNMLAASSNMMPPTSTNNFPNPQSPYAVQNHNNYQLGPPMPLMETTPNKQNLSLNSHNAPDSQLYEASPKVSSPYPQKGNFTSMQNGPYSTPAVPFGNERTGQNMVDSLQVNGVSGNVNHSRFLNPEDLQSSPMAWQSPQARKSQSGSPYVPGLGAPGVASPMRPQFPGVQPQSLDGKPMPNPPQVPSSTGLPLPYGSQNVGTPSPQVTPGTSQPPSARSSRNPSPISTQRYDYMEGQFSNKPSPSNSSVNLQNAVPNSNASLGPPNLQGPGDNSSSMMSPHTSAPSPYAFSPRPGMSFNRTPISSQTGSNMMPQATTPQTTPMRQRYPQQVGYNNQSANQFASPMVNNQPSAAMQPSPMFNNQPGAAMQPSPMFNNQSGAAMQPSPMFNNAQQPQFSPPPLQGGVPDGPVGGISGYDPQLHAKMAGMSVHGSFSRLWGNDTINLLQDRNILPPIPLEAPKPVLTPDRPNCSPDIFRCTLTKVPDTSSLLQKSRLPFGILIHPFKDASSLSVIQCNTIVRCRSCRTYINPFVSFIDQRRWKCNLCFRVNDLPEEFLYDPSTRSYGDPARRPEIKNATMEFIAPSDYMLRPPQPAVYLFLLDVSHGAAETGYLQSFCKRLEDHLDDLPGDSRTRVGFITFDGSIHFYNLGEGLNQPHMLVVSDIEDVFLPSPDNLLVNLHESKPLIVDLLNDLPKRFAFNGDTNSCLGAALQVAFKLMSPVGGRVTVVQTCLPNHGPGALKNREDPNQRAAKDVSNVGPAHDFYKKLALDCSGQQIAVDLFLMCSQYVDIATISCISKYSSGCINYYPGFHHQLGPLQVQRFNSDLKRYLTRRIGFEAVMRIRCTKGLAIHAFHGNFFVRSTDLLSLPNVTPDIAYGMQIAIEENLTDCNTVCFQAAVLYTSSNGERRIRVHTLSLPVVSILQDVLGGADQEAIIGLVSKMAVDRSLTSSLSDARDALINVCLDVLGVYKQTLSGQVAGALMTPYSTRLLPLFILSLLKHVAFRTGVSTKLDDRVYAMDRMKSLPLSYLMKYIYPTMYPVHALDDKNAIHQDDDAIIPQPVILQLSSEKVDRHGAYLLDTYDTMYLFVGRAINDHFCNNVLNVPNFSAIPEDLISLPELPTPESERLRNFISWLQDQRPTQSPLKVIREDSHDRHIFLQYMLDDRTESLFSYYEFLQHIRQQVSK